MDRPILFSTPMVKAILDGRKTMTRRVCKNAHIPCSPYQIGMRLWVRETFRYYDGEGDETVQQSIEYRADGDPNKKYKDLHWKPSIFMPRWASRITLEITNVKVERLQEITEGDAEKEGVQPTLWFQPTKNEDDDLTLSDNIGNISYKNGFANIWQKINGKKYPWASNPWVWVIEFERVAS
jgi:hypothetical protein